MMKFNVTPSQFTTCFVKIKIYLTLHVVLLFCIEFEAKFTIQFVKSDGFGHGLNN